MKKTLPLLLLLLLCLLCSCSSKSAEPPALPSDPAAPSENENPSTVPGDAETIHIILPEGVCAQICESMKTSGSPLEVRLTQSSDEISAALKDGSADLALVSTAEAVNLFQSMEGKIQCAAVVAVQSSDEPTQGEQAAECLVVSVEYAKAHAGLIQTFLTDYGRAASNSPGAFLAVSWDMVDAVQNACEVLFSANQIKSIPDDSFYYFPS